MTHMSNKYSKSESPFCVLNHWFMIFLMKKVNQTLVSDDVIIYFYTLHMRMNFFLYAVHLHASYY